MNFNGYFSSQQSIVVACLHFSQNLIASIVAGLTEVFSCCNAVDLTRD